MESAKKWPGTDDPIESTCDCQSEEQSGEGEQVEDEPQQDGENEN